MNERAVFAGERIAERLIARAEVDDSFGDLTLARARAERLVVDLHVRRYAGVLRGPARVEGMRERGAGADERHRVARLLGAGDGAHAEEEGAAVHRVTSKVVPLP